MAVIIIIKFVSLFYFIIYCPAQKRNYIYLLLLLIVVVFCSKELHLILYYNAIQYIYYTLIIIFAPWLLPLTFSWHGGISHFSDTPLRPVFACFLISSTSVVLHAQTKSRDSVPSPHEPPALLQTSSHLSLMLSFSLSLLLCLPLFSLTAI